jgi:GrpB-like predicted nucleotidyltransferase (UPF0157 family)
VSEVRPEPLGLESGTVLVVPWDARWPILYQQEEARIAAGLRPLALSLEHVGSTAVPGLAAKPVIDILAGYRSREELPGIIAALRGAGYEHRGENGIPGREFFRRGMPRSWHIHLVAADSGFWRDHLAFRDRLRADPALRDAYGELKRSLAARYPRNRTAYIDGKTAFVLAAIGR